MFAHLRPALVLLGILVALTGLVYPLAVTGIAQLAFPRQSNGSLVQKDGRVVGSAIIGQWFASDRYFRSRPSATSAADPSDPSKTIDAPYNAAGSAGSNLGPLSQKLIDRVKAEIDAVRAQGVTGPLPVDAVTASGSGLDPHVSPQTALLQVARIAKARGLPEARLQALVAANVEGRALGVLGEPRVNVLSLNLALDGLRP